MSALLLISCAALAGCGHKGNPDLQFQNDNYSYISDEALAFSSDIWCPYDEAYLRDLRDKYELEEMVTDCKSDFEKVRVITKWVTNLWSHDGDNIPEQGDPLFILQKVTEEGAQYRCVEYGVVIAGCLNALGIPARAIGLKTEDVETREYGAGHVATEAYLKDYRKWIFIDGQWGMIPMMGDLPLNAIQLGAVLAAPEKYEDTLQYLSFGEQSIGAREYNQWIGEYLYYFNVSGYQKDGEQFTESTLMLTPSDAPKPTIFQQKYPLEMDEYTHSVPAFYPAVI